MYTRAFGNRRSISHADHFSTWMCSAQARAFMVHLVVLRFGCTAIILWLWMPKI